MVVTVACVVAACSDWQESSFTSTAAAEAAGAVARGWLPAILPPGATTIREIHNLDSGFSYACFFVDPRQLGAVRELLQKEQAKTAGPRRLPSPPKRGFPPTIPTWWPAELVEKAAEETWTISEPQRFEVWVALLPTGNICMSRRYV